MKRITSLTELKGVMTALPRGGYLVDTSAGYIQFGSPPETLKDTILLRQAFCIEQLQKSEKNKTIA